MEYIIVLDVADSPLTHIAQTWTSWVQHTIYTCIKSQQE